MDVSSVLSYRLLSIDRQPANKFHLSRQMIFNSMSYETARSSGKKMLYIKEKKGNDLGWTNTFQAVFFATPN